MSRHLQLVCNNLVIWGVKTAPERPVRIPLPKMFHRSPEAPSAGWLVAPSGSGNSVDIFPLESNGQPASVASIVSLPQVGKSVELFTSGKARLELRNVELSNVGIESGALSGLAVALSFTEEAESFFRSRDVAGAALSLGVLLLLSVASPYLFKQVEDPLAPPPEKIAKLLIKPKSAGSSGKVASATSQMPKTIQAATKNVQQFSSTRLVQSLKSITPSMSKFLQAAPMAAHPAQQLETLKASRALASLASNVPTEAGARADGPKALGGASGGAGGYGAQTVQGNGIGSGSKSVAIEDLTQKSEVEEGLTRDEVGRVIHSKLSEIRYCYESNLMNRPNLEGKLTLSFTILPTGLVKSASASQSEFQDSKSTATSNAPQFENCLIRRLVTWKFPHPKGGVTVGVTYPFVFKSLGN